MHLAQLNITRAKYPLDDPRIADFVNALELVNGIGERSEGFVWRLKDESGNATSMHAFDDPAIIANLTVWESVEHLQKFVWKTVHKRFFERRAEWFDTAKETNLVMWRVVPGHRPTLVEARERLEHLRAHGPTDHAFGWKDPRNDQLTRNNQSA